MFRIAIDCETTGIDLYHGAKPYLVTICEEGKTPEFWEWDVDPLTREPDPKQIRRDIYQIKDMIFSADEIITHNGKFDITALQTVIPDIVEHWPWEKHFDTLMATHLLESILTHNLTDVATRWLKVNIKPVEDALEKACKEARNFCRHKLPHWKLAREGEEEMPSVKGDKKSKNKGGADERPWKNDGWLPRTLCRFSEVFSEKEHPWKTVLSDYAVVDSAATVACWPLMKKKIIEEGLWDNFIEDRMPLIRAGKYMEQRGVSISLGELGRMKEKYLNDSYTHQQRCMGIAASYDYELELPKGGGRNNNLEKFMFEVMKLPVEERTEAGKPCIDKEVMAHYTVSLPDKSRQLYFCQSLLKMRKVEKSKEFLEGYLRFGIPDPHHDGFVVLHPNFNPTGTSTTRWGTTNPAVQTVSKAEDSDGNTVRWCFCPSPDRELWSMDAKNIELRIPFYVSGEEALIDLFERPNDPPYYGSNHLANFHAVYPDIWDDAVQKVGFDKAGPYCKKTYAATWYQWCKNGGFAKQYGGQRRKVDATFRRKGCFDLLESKFSKLATLNKAKIDMANRLGYVETMPVRGRARGYPLMCTRTSWESVLPTVPLSYFVQGTAMEWTNRAMLRCEEQLRKWRAEGFDAYVMMQVHDELVFNFPRSKTHPKEDLEREKRVGKGKPYFRSSNLWRARVLQRLMEKGGEDIGLPTPVGVEYHDSSWGVGMTM